LKHLIQNIITLIAAIIVSIPIFLFGIPYSLFHSVVMSFKERNFKVFFYLFRLVNGLLFSFGYLLFHIAKSFDLLWCVCAGELFEDLVTIRENTLFGTFITISEATGKEEKEGFLTPFGKWFSNLLNKVFGQIKHCLDAYELGLKKIELETNYYN
jgi:hypothetical protein